MSPFDAVKGNEDEDMRWSVGTWEYDSESTSESEVASESDKESESDEVGVESESSRNSPVINERELVDARARAGRYEQEEDNLQEQEEDEIEGEVMAESENENEAEAGVGRQEISRAIIRGRFVTEEEYKTYIRTLTDDPEFENPFVCRESAPHRPSGVCGQLLTTKKTFLSHRKTHNNIRNLLQWRCPNCTIWPKTRLMANTAAAVINRHLLSEIIKIKCPVSGCRHISKAGRAEVLYKHGKNNHTFREEGEEAVVEEEGGPEVNEPEENVPEENVPEEEEPGEEEPGEEKPESEEEPEWEGPEEEEPEWEEPEEEEEEPEDEEPESEEEPEWE